MDYSTPGSSVHGIKPVPLALGAQSLNHCTFREVHDHFQLSSVQFSCSLMSDFLWPHGLQHNRLPCPSPIPRAYSNSSPSSHWCHPTISSSAVPFSSRLQSSPASRSFPMSQFFSSDGQKLEFQLQHQCFQWIFRADFLQEWLIWCSCSPRDPQESSPTPQFNSINSLALSFLYSPTLTSIHDYWKNQVFDKIDFCWQSNISVFKYAV